MIDDKQIQEAIAYCQGKVEPKREDAILLAACYIIQDHFHDDFYANAGKNLANAGKNLANAGNNLANANTAYSFAPPPAETPQITAAPETVGEYGSSEFLQAIVGKDPATCWGVMDELMDDLSVINPRVYAGVMRKIR